MSRTRKKINRTSLHSRLKQVLVSGLRHPLCARKVALMDGFGTLGLRIGVDAEEQPYDLAPISPFFFGYQQSQIDCQVSFVIGV